MTSYLDELERFYPKNREEWHQWLKDNHQTSPGVWVIYYKKNSSQPRVEYEDAVEEALSFGWIDSKVNAIDDERYMQVFTPRKKGSFWSKHNKRRIHKLINEGRMQKAGLKKVEKAKLDGSWSFLDDIEALLIPDDLREELNKNKIATENFSQYPDSVKKQVLYWIATAKREVTRKKRIRSVAESAHQNEKPF